VFVYIWNKTNGSRISTYTLPGRRGSKEVCLNGSAARTCELHDEVIIALPRYQHAHEMKSQEAKVVTFNHSLGVNTVGEIIHYVWDEKGGFSLKECPTV
jgi:aspartate 1-decarboxylase